MMSGGEVLNLEEADPEKDTFGVGKVEDFSWKGWLDFATCTECGRCQSQCPAWNTAKPLSPKLVMLALRDHAFAKAPYLRAGGGIDAGTVRRSSARRTWRRSRMLDPLAMLEAGRPLIGPAEIDDRADRWAGSSTRRCCGTARPAGRAWSSARWTSSTSTTSWTCAATR